MVKKYIIYHGDTRVEEFTDHEQAFEALLLLQQNDPSGRYEIHTDLCPTRHKGLGRDPDLSPNTKGGLL